MFRVATGCDVQYSHGAPVGGETFDFNGEFTYGFRGWKGEHYLDFLGELFLVAVTTLSEDPAGNWTTHNSQAHKYIEKPKQQIDYVNISRSLVGKSKCEISRIRLDASSTGHRSTLLTIMGNGSFKPWSMKPPHKSTGWQCVDVSFASRVADALNVCLPDRGHGLLKGRGEVIC